MCIEGGKLIKKRFVRSPGLMILLDDVVRLLILTAAYIEPGAHRNCMATMDFTTKPQTRRALEAIESPLLA